MAITDIHGFSSFFGSLSIYSPAVTYSSSNTNMLKTFFNNPLNRPDLIFLPSAALLLTIFI
jgi:hypothetical protein